MYLNGKLSGVDLLGVHYFRHKLKTNPNKKYTYIEFAANNKDIQRNVSPYELSEEPYKNFIDNTTANINGRQLLVFKRLKNYLTMIFI